MSVEKETAFGHLISNLQMVIDQIKDEDAAPPPKPDFSLDKFWSQLGACVQSVSAAATKLSLAFSEPPFPSEAEMQPLISGMEQSVLTLVACFYYLPVSQGLTLRRAVTRLMVDTAEALQGLVRSLQSKYEDPSSKGHLQSTGGVWEICDKFSQLPRDNTKAILLQVHAARDLITDAMSELEEALKEEEEEEDPDDPLDSLEDTEDRLGGLDIMDCPAGWSDADRLVIGACLGLIKTASACTKKVSKAVVANGRCDEVRVVNELDEYVKRINPLSPAVDELVSSLYPPVKLPAVRSNCERLAAVTNELLVGARQSHFTSDSDSTWLDFLHKAVDHNMDKVNGLISSMHSDCV